MTSLGYAAARAIGATLRIELKGGQHLEGGGGKIVAGWHGETFVPAMFWRGKGVWTIISQSRDGEMQARVFGRLGFKVIRGSTGRGGVRAAVEAINVLRDGALMAFTPDGPRGPSGVVQGGLLLMAKKSGAAIIPAGVSSRRRWRLGTWDRYQIPKPFSRAVIVLGEPIEVPAHATEIELEQSRLRVEAEIRRLQNEAERAMGHKPECAGER